MKTRSKKRWVIVLTAFLVLTVMLSFAACGESGGTTMDYSSMIYPDYHALYKDEVKPEGVDGYWDYWDTKEVEYQFVNATHPNNHGFAAFFPTLLNLYKDGTVKAWQRCTAFIGSMFDSLAGETEEESKFYADYKVLELFYGYWSKDAATGEITLQVQNSCDYVLEGANIQYKEYKFGSAPDSDGKIGFFFDATEKGQLISTYMVSDTNYEGTIQYKNFIDYANGIKVGAES